jgi:outer membrane beta-barrel protein
MGTTNAKRQVICLTAYVSLFFVGIAPLVARADEPEILPPAPVKVLQNRFFNKALRPEFSLFVGRVLNESYTESTSLGLRLGFFFSEWIGVDYSYATFQVDDSADREALRGIEVYKRDSAERLAIDPSFVSLKSLNALMLTVAPIYGKVNVFDWVIFYSDIYFSAGVGALETNQGSKTPVIFGLGQRFYFAQRFNVRIDAWDHVFQQERENLGTKKKSIKHAWTVALGASVFLW